MTNLLRLLIMGPPGSGKGTISSRIVSTFGLAYLASGDLLRSHILKETVEGIEAKKYIQEGCLVPDDLVTKLVLNELNTLSRKNWLLDGFPRTIKQAAKLDNEVKLTSVISLNVPDQVIIYRLEGRWVHIPSGRIYHTEFNPPKIAGIDDMTGEKLSQRIDDLPETVTKRLENHKKITEPLLQYFRNRKLLREFSGSYSDEIWIDIENYVRALTVEKSF